MLRGSRAPHNLPHSRGGRPSAAPLAAPPSPFAPVAVKHYFGSASQPARASVRSTETARELAVLLNGLLSFPTPPRVSRDRAGALSHSTHSLLFARAAFLLPSHCCLLLVSLFFFFFFFFLLLLDFPPFSREANADVKLTRMTQYIIARYHRRNLEIQSCSFARFIIYIIPVSLRFLSNFLPSSFDLRLCTV